MATAVLVVGTLISAAAALQQGSYQRKVANYNAQVAERKKVAIQQKAELDVQRHREDLARLKGSQRVAYGASGVQLSGTPISVFMDTERQGLLDEKIIKYNAAQAIAGSDSEIALTKAQGEQAFQSGVITAGTSILSGAGKYMKNKNSLLAKTS